MLNNIVIGRYYPIKSKIHNMNPMAKLISIILFLILSFLSDDLVVNLIVAGYVFIIMGMSNVPFKVYFKNLYGLRILFIFIVLINMLSGMSITSISIMLIRTITLVLYTTILTLTTTPTLIALGLERLFKPLEKLKLPISKMALSISLALRFIPTIFDQASKVLKSQASRGMDIKNVNIKGKIEMIVSMLIPMFILSFKRADALADAMEVRLYNVNRKRTNYRDIKWTLFDSYVVNMHLISIITLILSEVLK
jgi:energy-coupling factor transport system permease protein